MKKWYVYMMSNKKHWTIYIWVTSDIIKRVYQHKNKQTEWFTKKYNLTKLVYYETYNNISEALEREKRLKWGNRSTKISLIEESNPERLDLLENLI